MTVTVGEPVSMNGCEVTVLDYHIYSRDELDTIYQNCDSAYEDKNDLFINISIINNSDQAKKVNALGSGMMYGYNYGGNPNPELYNILNKDASEIITLDSGEKMNITLAFPCESEVSDAVLVLSLYPQKINVRLL